MPTTESIAPSAPRPPLEETLTISAEVTPGFTHVYQFHVFGNVNIKDEVEVSRMANRGGGSLAFNHGKMPTVVTGTIECKGGLAVPEMRRHVSQVSGSQFQYYTQRISTQAQLSILDAIVGKIVTIDCRGLNIEGVRGLFRQGTKRPDLDYDDGVFFDFELYEDPPSSSTSGLSLFGDITLEFVPADSPLPGGGEESCKPTTKITKEANLLGVAAATAINPIWGMYLFATSDDPDVEDSRDSLKEAGIWVKEITLDNVVYAVQETGKAAKRGFETSVDGIKTVSRWAMKPFQSQVEKPAEVCN